MPAELENNPTFITVVAVALRAAGGRWLMHRRPLHKHHGGLWEFPGGKVEPGEEPRDALVREVKEELGLALDRANLAPVAFAESGPDSKQPAIVILLYTAASPETAPRPIEGGALGWFSADEVPALPMPPLDIALSEQLFQRPDRGIANPDGPAYEPPSARP